MHDRRSYPESSTEKVAQRPRGQAEISRTPLAVLDRFITPTHLHYVRDHLTGEVHVDPQWRLRIEGLVRAPLALTRADLEELPMTELPVTMECAGNGGPNSVIGGIGCISTAVWRGARLRDVLHSPACTRADRRLWRPVWTAAMIRMIRYLQDSMHAAFPLRRLWIPPRLSRCI